MLKWKRMLSKYTFLAPNLIRVSGEGADYGHLITSASLPRILRRSGFYSASVFLSSYSELCIGKAFLGMASKWESPAHFSWGHFSVLTVTTPMSTYPTISSYWSTRAWWFWEAPMIPKFILIPIIYPHPNNTFRNGKALWCLERSQLSIIRTQLKKLQNTNLLTTLLPWICI